MRVGREQVAANRRTIVEAAGRLFRERGFAVEEMPLHKREAYSGTAIRKRIYEGGDWMPYLPNEVSAYILEIDGPQRIRETFRYSTPYGTRENEAD